MGVMTREALSQYKEKLEKGILEYMGMPAGERFVSGIRGMLECWSMVDAAERSMCSGNPSDFNQSDAEAWVAHMVNEDGSTGGHWTMEQTSAVAESLGISWDKITPWCWWVTMNMMYSDYSGVAEKYGVSIAEFYADMACAFLMDKDAPGAKEKLGAYYHGIAEKN
nr:MAG TPA: hypothetical protein [Caudoviricetes sp.]